MATNRAIKIPAALTCKLAFNKTKDDPCCCLHPRPRRLHGETPILCIATRPSIALPYSSGGGGGGGGEALSLHEQEIVSLITNFLPALALVHAGERWRGILGGRIQAVRTAAIKLDGRPRHHHDGSEAEKIVGDGCGSQIDQTGARGSGKFHGSLWGDDGAIPHCPWQILIAVGVLGPRRPGRCAASPRGFVKKPS